MISMNFNWSEFFTLAFSIAAIAITLFSRITKKRGNKQNSCEEQAGTQSVEKDSNQNEEAPKTITVDSDAPAIFVVIGACFGILFCLLIYGIANEIYKHSDTTVDETKRIELQMKEEQLKELELNNRLKEQKLNDNDSEQIEEN